jgi:hypothetical protein
MDQQATIETYKQFPTATKATAKDRQQEPEQVLFLLYGTATQARSHLETQEGYQDCVNNIPDPVDPWMLTKATLRHAVSYASEEDVTAQVVTPRLTTHHRQDQVLSALSDKINGQVNALKTFLAGARIDVCTSASRRARAAPRPSRSRYHTTQSRSSRSQQYCSSTKHTNVYIALMKRFPLYSQYASATLRLSYQPTPPTQRA